MKVCLVHDLINLNINTNFWTVLEQIDRVNNNLCSVVLYYRIQL